jgi:hypothetical protein
MNEIGFASRAKQCPALKRIDNGRHFSEALKRSSPRINSGAATVTPRLRRDECGAEPKS